MSRAKTSATAEQLDAIERAVAALAPRFCYPGTSVEDVAQEGRMAGWRLIMDGSYDPSIGPFAGFVYRHIRNRLHNHKRDSYRRPDSPCKQCAASGSCPRGAPCRRHASFVEANAARLAVHRPLPIGEVVEDKEGCMRTASEAAPAAEMSELLARIDAAMPAGLRPHYLRMREGLPVPAGKRAEVERVVCSVSAGS